MKAAVFESTKKPLVVKNVPDPECAPNGAIVRVEANGICRSDWHAWSGDWSWMGLSAQPGAILGHEFSGVVQEVGKDIRNFKQGDRVTWPGTFPEQNISSCRVMITCPETARDQFGESANHAGRVGELKFGSRFADRRYLAFVHEHNNSSTPMSR
jgi:D-arabinose 1-dehydrogenase-like Zn-dependent alcohol dehydrogenase